MDVERIKAQLTDARLALAPSRVSLAIPTMSPYDASMRLLSLAESLVAAVERVQALHVPGPSPSSSKYCCECADPYPCPTIKVLERS